MHTEFDKAFNLLNIKEEERLSYAELLRQLDVPDDLKFIKAVLKNFVLSFEDAWLEDIRDNDGGTSHLYDSLNKAMSLIERLEMYPRYKEFARDPATTKLSKLLYGALTKNPLYPLHYILNNDNPDFFKWLRQVVFIVPFLGKDKASDRTKLKFYEHRKISELFRQMTEDPTAILWLKNINCTQCHDLQMFVSWLYEYRMFYRKYHNLTLSDVNNKGAKSSTDPKRRAIAVYRQIFICIRILEIPLGIEKRRKADTSPSPKKRQTTDIVSMQGVTALEGNALVQIETLPEKHNDENILFSIIQTQLSEQHEDAGEEIFEQQQDEMYLFAEHEPMESYIAAFHGRRLSKSVMRRLERQHQYLTTDRRCLSNTQVYQLLTWCKQEKSDHDTAEAAMVAVLAFFTASLPANLSATTDGLHNEGFPKLSLDTSTIVLPVFSLLYATADTEPDQDDKLQGNRQSKSAECQGISLTMPDELRQAFVQHSNKSNFIWAENGQPLLRSRFCQPDQALQKVIQTQTGLEITAHQIANHLFLRACTMFGSACATLMFNRPAPGSQARLYYTSLPVTLIQQRYQELICNVMQDAGLEPPEVLNEPAKEKSFQIGCRNAPDKSDYRNLLSALRDELSTLRKNLLSTDWIKFHNRYTAYCIVAQGLLTGIRPTHAGFISFDNMLLDAKVAVVRDKDSADEYHTRTIPLHSIAIKIAQAYDEHIHSILGRLHRIGLLQQWQSAGHPGPFFFTNTKTLDDSYKVAIMPFRPSLLSQEIEPYFTLPPNSNRKLLRSFFEMKGVSSMCTDALLGHGNLGEMFWHQHNTLSLNEIRQTLLPHLNELAESLDIRAIQGMTT